MSFARYMTTSSLGKTLGILSLVLAGGCAEPGHTASGAGETTVVAADAGMASAPTEDKDAGIFQSAAGYYLAAREADSNGDLTKAADFMAEALKHDPENVDLMRDAFQLRLADGRMAEAAELAQRLVAKLPDNQLGNVMLALEEARAGRFQEAEARMAKLPRVGLGGVVAPLIQAWALQGAGKTDDALKALDQLSGMRGFSVLHDFHAAFLDEMVGRTAAAEAAFKSTLAAESSPSFRVIKALADFYARHDRVKEALDLFATYRKSNPDTVRVELTTKLLKSGVKPALHR
ncbi:MAG: tetratricopeptide repeat protein [Alphaproteobacteria bacterium]